MILKTDQKELARDAARALWEIGISAEIPPDPRTPEFADAALSELERLRNSTPGILKNVLDGAEIGAAQLDVDPMHGLAELVQNADDLGASEIRMGIRSRGAKRDLVLIHNGRPVELRDVLAMALAFVSTKRTDPISKGKFGIGLKTLSRIADSMDVSCTPYHFRIAGNQIEAKKQPRSIRNFYNPKSKFTLIVLPLKESGLETDVEQWARSWSPAKMIFLQSVRSLHWVDITKNRTTIKHDLSVKVIEESLPWRRQGKEVRTQTLIIKDPKNKLKWTRYDAFVPIPKKITRAFKAAGTEAAISVAVPDRPVQNLLFAGLPTKIQLDIPFAINAPFDTNTVRSQIQKGRWNTWLWQRVSEFVTELVLHLLEHNPKVAWYFVPIWNETNVEDDAWLTERLREMYGAVKNAVQRRRWVEIQANKKTLSQISYEVSALEDLLQFRDYKVLTNGLPSLPREIRDSEGRWRSVLDDLEIATRIDIVDALALFSNEESLSTARTPNWFIQLVAVALEVDLGDKLRGLPCILTDNPVMAMIPDDKQSGSKLVKEERGDTLASRLGLIRRLHPSYFHDGEPHEKVRTWLQDLGQLSDEINDLTLLHYIAERGSDHPVHIIDSDLVALRDLVDRVGLEIDKQLIRSVGCTILLDAFEWVGSRRVYKRATAATTYLPAAVDREPEGWSSAAGKTTGLTWVAPRYAKLLNPGVRGSGVSGARKFLSMLGAATGPRLQDINRRYLRGADEPIPTLQSMAFKTFTRWPEFLIGDHESPDLEKVVASICDDRQRERRKRGLYLFRTLNRSWLRNYQQAAMCTAGYKHYTEYDLGDVPSTWIARLADEPWLQTETGRIESPRLLDIRTPLTEDIYGNAKDRFAWGLKDDDTSGFTAALGLQERPKASAIIDQLIELRRKKVNPDNLQVRGIYQYLSRLCPPSSLRPDVKVDDLTVAQIRGQFGIHPRRPGLLWIDGQWQAPSSVRRGRPIFGNRCSFVPESRATERLWNVLGIRTPNIRDCIDVLNDIAAKNSPAEEQTVLIDVYHHINNLLPMSNNRERLALASIPLSLSERWTNERPVYVLDDSTARDSLAASIPMWYTPCSLDGLDRFLEVCKLSRIPATDCTATGINPANSVVDNELETEFRNAVGALQNYLVRNEPQIYQDLSLDWPELYRAHLVVSSSLGLEVSLPDGSIISSACDAHLDLNTLTIYLRNKGMLFKHDSGGRVISQCFNSMQSRNIVSLAWSNSSIRASFASEAPMALAEDNTDHDDPLELIRATARGKIGSQIAPARRDAQPKTSSSTPLEPITPRKLKTVGFFNISSVEVINTSAAGGKLKPSHKPKLKSPGDKGAEIGGGGASKSAPRGYTDNEREQLALEVLAAVINDHKTKLKDFTKLKLVGADTGDGLKRFFEIKAYSGEMPDIVNIEMSEILRAQEVGKDFYLAVIAGLEEGYPTVIKLFAKPLETLDWMQGTSIKLAGVKSKRAVEIHIDIEPVSGKLPL